MSKRKEVRERIEQKRREHLPVWTAETSVIVDIAFGNISPTVLEKARINFRIIISTVVLGETVKVIHEDRRLSDELKENAYRSLEKTLLFVDTIASMDQDVIDIHLRRSNELFERNDNRVRPMDRIILACAASIKPEVFITADRDFLDNKEVIRDEFGIQIRSLKEENLTSKR